MSKFTTANRTVYAPVYLVIDEKLKENGKKRGINFTKLFRETLIEEIKKYDTHKPNLLNKSQKTRGDDSC